MRKTISGFLKSEIFWILLFGVTLFLFLCPLTQKINFYQNDDWVYYKTVQSFMQRNFKLDGYIEATFYAQGIIGALFSFVFGISHLPFLTLLFSVLNYALVAFTCYRFFGKKLWLSILTGLVVFLNPWHAYSIWGFMTENFFLSFLLAGILMFLYFDETKKRKFIFLSLLFGFFAFMIRQVSVVLPVSLTVYYILKRDWKSAAWPFVATLLELAFYFLLFPKTTEMTQDSFLLQHLSSFDYMYSLIYSCFLLLTAVLLPYFIFIFDAKEFKNSYKKIGIFVIAWLGLLIVLDHYFKPDVVSWGEFPYIKNIWERRGYYPRGILGTKYYFAGMFSLYKYWDLLAKVVFSGFIAYVVLIKRRIVNFFLILTVIYLGAMSLVSSFYDRYLLVLVPIMIFYLLSFEIKFDFTKKVLLGIFVLFLGLFAYQFSVDFVLSNRYVWDRSLELVQQGQVLPTKIICTNAWRLTYFSSEKNYLYKFSFDSQEANPTYAKDYYLVEAHEISFPLNIFKNLKIYLYKKIVKTDLFNNFSN